MVRVRALAAAVASLAVLRALDTPHWVRWRAVPPEQPAVFRADRSSLCSDALRSSASPSLGPRGPTAAPPALLATQASSPFFLDGKPHELWALRGHALDGVAGSIPGDVCVLCRVAGVPYVAYLRSSPRAEAVFDLVSGSEFSVQRSGSAEVTVVGDAAGGGVLRMRAHGVVGGGTSVPRLLLPLLPALCAAFALRWLLHDGFGLAAVCAAAVAGLLAFESLLPAIGVALLVVVGSLCC
eukprot:m51a1_g10702 hypothetical protein (239) ;mRNA; r:158148-159281